MAICNINSVISNATCKESTAGVSNHMFAVPIENIGSITPNDDTNQYDITLPENETSLKGYRIDYKSQTGQVTSEDNGMGKGWTASTTGRVELNKDGMAHTARGLHNSDKFVYFVATGQKKTEQVDGQSVTKHEYIVIGNENGEAEFSVTSDTGTARSDDHGLTFTVSCGFQVYPETKFYGVIAQVDAV